MKLPDQLSQRRISVGEKFANNIIDKINNGDWKTGDALPPTVTLAENCGISLVTAHKSLQRLVQSGYLKRKSGRGTFVSDLSKVKHPSAPRTLARGGSVGLPVFLHPNPVHLALVEEISNQASVFGFDLRMGQGHAEALFIKKIAKENVKFILRSPRLLKNEAAIMRELKKYGMFAVNLNNFWSDCPDFPQVRTDIKTGVRMIVEHLKKLGHKKIAFVDESNYFPRFDILGSLCKVFMWNDLEFDVNCVQYTRNYGEDWIDVVMDKLLDKYSAIIFSYDYHAVLFAEKMKERGLVPGKDLSLVGIDNIFMAEQAGLTSLAHPMHEIVKTAFKIITGELPGGEKIYEIAPKLIVRESTARNK